MSEIDNIEKFLQEIKVEFMAEDVERSTEKETEIDRAYARGWNNCQRTILSNILEILEKNINAAYEAEIGGKV